MALAMRVMMMTTQMGGLMLKTTARWSRTQIRRILMVIWSVMRVMMTLMVMASRTHKINVRTASA